MQTQIAKLQQQISDCANSVHNKIFGESKPESREVKSPLNSRVTEHFRSEDCSKSTFTMTNWEVASTVAKAVASVAIAALGIYFATTFGLTMLGVGAAAFFVGTAVSMGIETSKDIMAAFKTNFQPSTYLKYLELNSKSDEELNALYTELSGKDFETYFDDEIKQVFEDQTGHKGVRSLTRLMADACMSQKVFDAKAEKYRVFDEYMYGYADKLNKDGEINRVLNVIDPAYNKFIIEEYCPAKMNFSYMIYLLQNPTEKHGSLLARGQFLDREFLSIGDGSRHDLAKVHVPVFGFFVEKDMMHVMTSGDICFQGDVMSTPQQLADSLIDSISEHDHEVSARKEIKEAEEAKETEDTHEDVSPDVHEGSPPSSPMSADLEAETA